MAPVTVYLALGTNLGERMLNLAQALALLPPTVSVQRCSPVYETPPWGVTDQPAFLNMACQAETELGPLELLSHLKFLEEKMGRKESVRYGPRLIDLDILFYADQIYHDERLDIPHPRLAERAFVLLPLAELAPGLKHPQSSQTAAELLRKVDPAGIKAVTSAENNPPAEIVRFLQQKPATLAQLQRQPPSHQREWLGYVLEAVKPATRRRRLEKMAAQLSAEGKPS